MNLDCCLAAIAPVLRCGEVSEASEDGSAGVLGKAGPLGNVEGDVGVSRGAAVGAVLAAELTLDDSAHGFALGGRGAFPVDSKALVTDGALDIVAGGLS